VGRHDALIRIDAVNQSAAAHDVDSGQVPAITGYWFACCAFHPDAAVLTAEARR
jgi:hypothetical protein